MEANSLSKTHPAEALAELRSSCGKQPDPPAVYSIKPVILRIRLRPAEPADYFTKARISKPAYRQGES